MRRNAARAYAITALFFFAFNCCDLYAIDVLDQVNAVAPGTTSIGALVVDEMFAPGQTIRAGLTGILSHVELGVYRDSTVASPMFVDIVRTQAGKPSFAVADRLATRMVTQDQVPLRQTFAEKNAPGFTVSVDFLSSALSFNSGDLFAIALRSDAPQFFSYYWWVSGDTINTYPAGSSYSYQYATNSVLGQGPKDTQFATYVAVPEPTSGLLCIVAIVATQLRPQRRRSR